MDCGVNSVFILHLLMLSNYWGLDVGSGCRTLLLRGGLRGIASPEPGMSLPEAKSQAEAPICQGPFKAFF